MVFFTATLSDGENHQVLESPLFPCPVAVNGAAIAGSDITIGIRPEHIRVSPGPLPAGVPARLVRKTVQIGGQYLVALDVHGLGNQGFKAKVSPTAGERLPASGQVNVELPLEQVSLFDADGIRIAASLHAASAHITD
jgi:ABC-type sugar transport system ATPase subunit